MNSINTNSITQMSWNSFLKNKLTREETDSSKRSVTSLKNEPIINNYKKYTPGPDGLTGEFHQKLKEGY